MKHTLSQIAHTYRSNPRDFWQCTAVVPVAFGFFVTLPWIASK